MNEEEKKLFEEMKSKVDTLTNDKKSSESKVEELTKRVSETEEENKKLKSELAETNKKLQDTREAYKEMFGDGKKKEDKEPAKVEKSALEMLADLD